MRSKQVPSPGRHSGPLPGVRVRTAFVRDRDRDREQFWPSASLVHIHSVKLRRCSEARASLRSGTIEIHCAYLHLPHANAGCELPRPAIGTTVLLLVLSLPALLHVPVHADITLAASLPQQGCVTQQHRTLSRRPAPPWPHRDGVSANVARAARETADERHGALHSQLQPPEHEQQNRRKPRFRR